MTYGFLGLEAASTNKKIILATLLSAMSVGGFAVSASHPGRGALELQARMGLDRSGPKVLRVQNEGIRGPDTQAGSLPCWRILQEGDYERNCSR